MSEAALCINVDLLATRKCALHYSFDVYLLVTVKSRGHCVCSLIVFLPSLSLSLCPSLTFFLSLSLSLPPSLLPPTPYNCLHTSQWVRFQEHCSIYKQHFYIVPTDWLSGSMPLVSLPTHRSSLCRVDRTTLALLIAASSLWTLSSPSWRKDGRREREWR